jgi:hypothetical protein
MRSIELFKHIPNHSPKCLNESNRKLIELFIQWNKEVQNDLRSNEINVNSIFESSFLNFLHY